MKGSLPKTDVLLSDPNVLRKTGERILANTQYRPGSCWIWKGRTVFGYGSITVRNEGMRANCRVHRAIYLWLVGPIEDGLVLDHRCRETRCVNPQHIEPVTSRENSARGNTNMAKRYCPACGGEYRFARSGNRYCPACRAARQRENKAGHLTACRKYRANHRDRGTAYKREWRSRQRTLPMPPAPTGTTTETAPEGASNTARGPSQET